MGREKRTFRRLMKPRFDPGVAFQTLVTTEDVLHSPEGGGEAWERAFPGLSSLATQRWLPLAHCIRTFAEGELQDLCRS